MIRDVVDGAAQLLLPGPLLALAGLSLACGAGACLYSAGRRSAFREVDEARAVVLAAVEDAARPSVALLLPAQRDGERS